MLIAKWLLSTQIRPISLFFILLDGFARVCTVSANFPDNPRTVHLTKLYEKFQLNMSKTQEKSAENCVFPVL